MGDDKTQTSALIAELSANVPSASAVPAMPDLSGCLMEPDFDPLTDCGGGEYPCHHCEDDGATCPNCEHDVKP